MKDCHPGSTASRVLEVICNAAGWVNTTEILSLLVDIESIATISAACRDLWLAKKIHRSRVDNRLVYCARQTEMFPGAADDLGDRSGVTPARKQPARHMTTRAIRGRAMLTTAVKLRTLDRVIAFVADDVALVLRAIRADLVNRHGAAT